MNQKTDGREIIPEGDLHLRALAAKRLSGMKQREIGERLGVSTSAVGLSFRSEEALDDLRIKIIELCEGKKFERETHWVEAKKP